MKKALLSDIDGTISDRSHRLHYLDYKKDWESFFKHSIYDPPLNDTITQIEKSLPNYDKLIFVTGRPEKYKSVTESWIKSNTSFVDYILMMRGTNDWRDDVIVKYEMLNEIKRSYEVDVIYEDQEKLARMWEIEGLKCIRVT